MKKDKKPMKITIAPDAFKNTPQADREAVMREFINLVQSGELERRAKPLTLWDRIKLFFKAL